jgi:hypothetical protein
MKKIKILNTIAISIPFVIALGTIFNQSFLILALLSTMVTGLLQLVTAVLFAARNPHSLYIRIYFILTAIFFLLWYIFPGNLIMVMPLCLCIFLSVIIYTQKDEAA